MHIKSFFGKLLDSLVLFLIFLFIIYSALNHLTSDECSFYLLQLKYYKTKVNKYNTIYVIKILLMTFVVQQRVEFLRSLSVIFMKQKL